MVQGQALLRKLLRKGEVPLVALKRIGHGGTSGGHGGPPYCSEGVASLQAGLIFATL